MARVIKTLDSGKLKVNRVWWSAQDKKWRKGLYHESVFHTTIMMTKGTKKSFVKDVFGKAS